MPNFLARGRSWIADHNRQFLPSGFMEAAPLDLRIVGRTVFHAALVGMLAGFAGAAFFYGLELVQRVLLQGVAGYVPLRAHGELASPREYSGLFRPWLMVLLPAIGGAACGLVSQLAPEVRGGGGDAMIRAFHHQGAVIRKRVISLKAVASMFTLGTGGAGGREGPTMQIGGALGSLVADVLHLSVRERRVLLVSGVAAGLAAVFRTPLGAALLAVEVLYGDGFESDALVPSVLASVVSYSVVISIYGESTLFAHSARFPFVAGHLPLYALLAICVALVAALFVGTLHRSKKFFSALEVAPWLRPALGGLALGLFCTALTVTVGSTMRQGSGLGLFGGGYGVAQVAISGANWLPTGWAGVRLLLLLSVAKIVAASLTIGSEGSAGDFAPSLVIGGLFGGAFGRAAALLLHDPRIDPGAFALVGMGAFYGGIAHVPLSALVLVCEMAGNYDLLVPLMLTQGIVYVALRKYALYEAQVPTLRDSPAHREAAVEASLALMHIDELMVKGRPHAAFHPETNAEEMLRRAGESTWQDVFPVTDHGGKIVGLVSSTVLPVLSMDRDGAAWAVAADVMQPPVSVKATDHVRTATELMLGNGLREIPVVDEHDRIIGFLDEAEVARAYVRAVTKTQGRTA